MTSNRYPTIKDNSGNLNNYYDPSKLNYAKTRRIPQSKVPHAIVSDYTHEKPKKVKERKREKSLKYLLFDNIPDTLPSNDFDDFKERIKKQNILL